MIRHLWFFCVLASTATLSSPCPAKTVVYGAFDGLTVPVAGPQTDQTPVHGGTAVRIAATAGGPLQGNFKWLLHLGQNPTDGFLSGFADPKALKPYMGGPFMPFPGQIYDFEIGRAHV